MANYDDDEALLIGSGITSGIKSVLIPYLEEWNKSKFKKQEKQIEFEQEKLLIQKREQEKRKTISEQGLSEVIDPETNEVIGYQGKGGVKFFRIPTKEPKETETPEQKADRLAKEAGQKASVIESAKFQEKLKQEFPQAKNSAETTIFDYRRMKERAMQILNDPALPYGVGFPENINPSKIPRTEGRRVFANIKNLKSQIRLNALISLKQLSSTGASGMGQLSNEEGRVLEERVAALDTSQNPEDFKNALVDVINFADESEYRVFNQFNSQYGKFGKLQFKHFNQDQKINKLEKIPYKIGDIFKGEKIIGVEEIK